MQKLTRRSALAAGLAGASVAMAGISASADAAGKNETAQGEGITRKQLGEGSSMIPGYSKVRLRDHVVQPGGRSPNPANAMKNPMVCHITAGELQVVQNGKEFTAKLNHIWTCNTGTTERVYNRGQVTAIMRIIDLLA